MASERDLEFTRRSLQLAARGTGLVSPNPLVGCVIVSTRGMVVGEGTYIYDNVAHAEQIAIEQAGREALGGTAYVSLEPHHHHGRTRPCTVALIEAGIKRVVCPIEDPNPVVSGKGFEHLRAVGVEVVTGILADEAAKQNEKFICWHKKQRPFVHLKLATSLDGRISVDRSVSTMLSGEAALKRVHDLRHEYDAILIGGNTASIDNPSLTDRSGKARRRPLVRVVLDNRLRLDLHSALVTTAGEAPVIVASKSTEPLKTGVLKKHAVDVVNLDARDIRAVLAEVYKREIQSVLVEGGSEVAASFWNEGYVDKATFIYSPVIIGGPEAPTAIGGLGTKSLDGVMRLTDITVARYDDDIEITAYPSSGNAG
jgi:diaminohydroxyphosphoribosylaminopyrimidine deaminase/5-amino-6-(5-phosphoribosylamino)uracil reductase